MKVYLKQDQEYAEMAQLASHQMKAERLGRFWEMLGWVLAKYPIPRGTGSSPVKVLDVACGVCEESRLISAFFSTGVAGFPSDGVELICLDSDLGAIQTAAASLDALDPFFYSPRFHIGMRAVFIHGDATLLDKMAEVPKELDFALMRHQFAVRSPDAVKKITEKVLLRLKARGVMLFTSFCEEEHLRLKKVLAEIPCEILLEKENPRALPIKETFLEGPVAIDKYVCLIRRSL